MTTPLSRRQWLLSTGVAAGSTVLAPSVLPAKGIPAAWRRLAEFATYHDALLAMEAEATAARRAAGPIRLAYNENPFGMSPKAKEAIANGWFEHSQYDLKSRDALKAAFARHVGVDNSHVLITQGSSETLSIAALAYGLHGAEIVAPHPTFELLPQYAETIGARVHRVPLTAEMGHDFAAMETRITSAVRLVFVCNPNNPTSKLEDGGTLRRFVSDVQHRSLVIVDEAYHDFVEAPGYRPMIDAVLRGENVIISRTASKIHGIAGLRVGFAIARPDIIARLAPYVTGDPNGFGMQAAAASIADTQYQEFVKSRNREGRVLLTQTLTAMGRRVVPSHTNFVFFHAGRPVEQVQSAMLARGFAVGRAFPPYLDWCRVSIGTPEEMTAFVAALPEALRA
jgi:histidinol-phosphate aminotransferase